MVGNFSVQTTGYNVTAFSQMRCHRGTENIYTIVFSQLRSIVDDATRKPFGPGVGSLTSENRDTWAKVHTFHYLLASSAGNSMPKGTITQYLIEK